jgi:hypothetical protein
MEKLHSSLSSRVSLSVSGSEECTKKKRAGGQWCVAATGRLRELQPESIRSLKIALEETKREL